MANEAPTLTIQLKDSCGRNVRPSDLGTANLYLSGPRSTLQTKTASKLLNCVTDRNAADRQHHFINLANPRFADATQSNLSTASDGTITYRLAQITTEPPGTYTAGVWAKTRDEVGQIFPLREFQIGTATGEAYASGTATDNKCFDCHFGPRSGKAYEAHTFPFPGFAPLGNYALDEAPVATCQMCHNTDGYSLNPIVRKVHGVHRGEHQTDAGVAHPEYGLGPDTSLAAFTNVGFPALFAKEKECVKCHKDDRWQKATFSADGQLMQGPSRLACGTCHDNLFWSTDGSQATLIPPRVFGGNCTMTSDCDSQGYFLECDVPTRLCMRKHHPHYVDAQCNSCHTAGDAGFSPIAVRHEIPQETLVNHLRLTLGTLTGADGGTANSPIFFVGDVPTFTFTLTNGDGTPRNDLITNSSLAANLLVAGPTTDRQRIVGTPNGAVNMRTTGTLMSNGSGQYTYTLAAALPGNSIPPVNAPGLPPRPNPAGTYTLYMYVVETLRTDAGVQYNDYASIISDFKFGADQPIQPRQVISNAACDSCHVQTSLHGNSRRDAKACSFCHSQGAMDRIVGATGASCTMASPLCGGSDAGWESCHLPSDGGTTGTCVIDTDPTPNVTIYFPVMVHNIHFARLSEGFSASNNLIPGTVVYVGFNNSVNDFSEVLFPQDVRNCTKCHTDSTATCTTSQNCGIGQDCVNGVCVNTAWMKASGKACVSCHHDAADAYAHVLINTYQQPDGGMMESCSVCHDPDKFFSVQNVHNISNPYVPPLPRERSN
jgi:hypothetical protein